MATLSRIPPNSTREICDRPQKKTISPKTCHTSPRSQQGKARSGLVRRSSEAPQLCTSCGFVWGDNGPFTAVLMAKGCLFVPPKIGPGFGWYPVRRCTTEEVKPWIFGRQKVLDPPLYWNIIFLRSDMFASLLLGHNSLPSMSTKPLKHSKTHISRPHSRAKSIH